nr:MAG TPA: hypothetical protein [Bacteriophage sp.]
MARFLLGAYYFIKVKCESILGYTRVRCHFSILGYTRVRCNICYFGTPLGCSITIPFGIDIVYG